MCICICGKASDPIPQPHGHGSNRMLIAASPCGEFQASVLSSLARGAPCAPWWGCEAVATHDAHQHVELGCENNCDPYRSPNMLATAVNVLHFWQKCNNIDIFN